MCVLFVVNVWLNLLDWEKGINGYSFLKIVFLLFLLISFFSQWRANKRVFFIQMNEKSLEWLLITSSVKTNIEWINIIWIKKEWDGGITFFQKSSFSEHLRLSDFSASTQKEVIDYIQQMANNRQIRLINFLEPISPAV